MVAALIGGSVGVVFAEANDKASCMVWTPDVKINRHFEQIYTYDAPGTYKVTFTRGPVASETLEVQVR